MIFYFSGNPRQSAGSIFENIQAEIKFFKKIGEPYIRLLPYDTESFKLRNNPEIVREIAKLYKKENNNE